MKICFVKYPGKATLVEPSAAYTAEQSDEYQQDGDGEDDGDDCHHHNDNCKNNVDTGIDIDDNNNVNKGDDIVCKEPLRRASSDRMNSYEASWQECRLKWCLRSRSKDRHNSAGTAAAAGWTEDDDDDNCCHDDSGGGGGGGGGSSSSSSSRGRTGAVAGRRNPSEKRQACSSDSTSSSQEEQDAAALKAAAVSARRPKAKALSRVQSVRHETTAHRYRTRQRVAAEMLDEQRAAANASAAVARDLCRSSAAKIKKSLSFRNPAPKKVAITGSDRLQLRPVADKDHRGADNRQLYHNNNRHHDNNHNHQHHYHHHLQHHDDNQQQRLLQTPVAVSAAAASATVVADPAVVMIAAAASSAADSGGQDNFAIPRPKLIVPVHTYGLRKRRTGNTISSNRTASDVNASSASSTVASSSGSSSNTASVDSKKHHNSCPGKIEKKNPFYYYTSVCIL